MSEQLKLLLKKLQVGAHEPNWNANATETEMQQATRRRVVAEALRELTGKHEKETMELQHKEVMERFVLNQKYVTLHSDLTMKHSRELRDFRLAHPT